MSYLKYNVCSLQWGVDNYYYEIIYIYSNFAPQKGHLNIGRGSLAILNSLSSIFHLSLDFHINTECSLEPSQICSSIIFIKFKFIDISKYNVALTLSPVFIASSISFFNFSSLNCFENLSNLLSNISSSFNFLSPLYSTLFLSHGRP